MRALWFLSTLCSPFQVFQNSYTWLILALETTNSALQVALQGVTQLSVPLLTCRSDGSSTATAAKGEWLG